MFIIIKRDDSGVSIAKDPKGDIEEFIDKWQSVSQARVVSWRQSESDVRPSLRIFRDAWTDDLPGDQIDTDMPKARDIHSERIAVAQAAEIARLKVEERKERLKSNTAQADAHATTVTALEALNLNALAIQIANAPNPTALSAIWPAVLPR